MTLALDLSRADPSGDVSLWWLGQACVALRGRSGLVVIDPFLTDYGGYGRTYAPPVAPSELTSVDILIGTHDHADHIDPDGFATIMRASASAVAVVPATAVERVVELGVERDRVRPAFADTPLQHGCISMTPFPAFHAPEPSMGYGFHKDASGRYPFLGVLVELDGIRVCHTGDTLIYEGLGARIASFEPDVLLVPINGRSWYRERRGVAGNLNAFEAAEVAEEVNARITIPIHWDLFADNTEDPHHFARYASTRHPSVNVHVPERGARVALGQSMRSYA